MSEIKEEKVVDQDYPLGHVPMHARKGLLSIAAVLLGFTFFSPTMLAGAQLGAAFSLKPLMIILIGGSVILGVYVAVMCLLGAKTGLTSVLLSKYTLGKGGAKWADIILGGTQIGWYAVTSAYMGELFAKGLGMTGWSVTFTIFWAVVMGITAVYGFKGMEIVSYFALPAILILVIYIPYLGVKEVGGWGAMAALQPASTMSIGAAITVVVGTFASGGTQAANWSRFAKNGMTGFWAGLIAFLLGNGLMIFSGMIGALAFNNGDLVEVMIAMNITVLALIILTMNIWTTNNATAYAFGVAGAELFNKPNKRPFIIGGVLIAIVLAVTGIYKNFIPMLVLFGTFIPPLGGVIIGDFFFTYKGKLPDIETVEFKNFRIAPVIAYVIGSLAAYLGGRLGIGIPPLQGIIIAALMVPVINAIIKAAGVNDMHAIKE
ncbi:MAG: cytosine permease [Spirochaetales bacterium]|uniref:Cytosine permease n=1 Tax=Candidatus Thalassospirochaeta sargassi TaxID=3119039 RepID=A0AAJ1IFZ3_9SPIO|nr:cytosine permease [Spirochaetales bacterium]